MASGTQWLRLGTLKTCGCVAKRSSRNIWSGDTLVHQMEFLDQLQVVWKTKVTTQGRDPGKRHGRLVLYELINLQEFFCNANLICSPLPTHSFLTNGLSLLLFLQVLYSIDTHGFIYPHNSVSGFGRSWSSDYRWSGAVSRRTKSYASHKRWSSGSYGDWLSTDVFPQVKIMWQLDNQFKSFCI